MTIANLRLAGVKKAELDELAGLYEELLLLLDAPNALLGAPGDFPPNGRGTRLGTFWLLACALKAEAEAAAANGQDAVAADYAVALIRLGDMLAHGGIVRESEHGDMLRNDGCNLLAQVRKRLPPDRIRIAFETLHRSLANREDPAACAPRQLDYEEREYGWRIRYDRALARLAGDVDPVSRFYDERARQYLLMSHVLQADLAIRLFERDHGRVPHDFNELVPDYLPSLPLDP